MEANLWLVTKKIIETRRWPFINLKNSNKFFCGCDPKKTKYLAWLILLCLFTLVWLLKSAVPSQWNHRIPEYGFSMDIFILWPPKFGGEKDCYVGDDLFDAFWTRVPPFL